jgi:hypothetical protein
VQRTKDSWGVHRGDIPNAGTNGLSLYMEVRLGRVPRISNSGNRLTDIDMITDLDLNAARAEMGHHQKMPATDVQDDVVAALVMAVGRSNRLVGPAVLDKGHGAGGGRNYLLAVDVVADQIGASRSVGAAALNLENVQGVTLGGGDLVVIDQFTVSALTDQPFIGKRRGYRHRIDSWLVDHDQLSCDEQRATQRQQV